MSIAYLVTDKNVSLTLDGKPHIISSTATVYRSVLDAIRENAVDSLRNLLKPKERIAAATEGRITYDGRELFFNGNPISNAIKERLAFLWEGGFDYKPLLRFLDNLMDNPSYRAVEETYRFLEACNLPITNDGHFLAYKMVRSDYLDIYSGTMDNSVGGVVEVPRNQVDEDSNRTCSNGLHACSQGYLGRYGSSGNNDRVMVVKINPRDVVAVPHDYNNAKMRVCRYEVVDELSWDDVGLNRYYTDSYGGDLDDITDDYDDQYNEDDSWLYDEYESSQDDDSEWDDDLGDEWSVEVTDLDSPSDVPEPSETASKSVSSSPVGQPIKLSASQVRDIKILLKQGEMTIAAIARLYGVNESTIRKIRDGKIWVHVTV